MRNKNTCDICGFVAKPRGLGAHKRLKHGITEGLVLRERDLSTVVKDDLCERSFDSGERPIDLSERISALSQKVARPSDYIPKKAVIEKRVSNTSDSINSLKETVKAQSGIIKNQGKVINSVLPDFLFDQTDSSDSKMVDKQSMETGQDLAECERPDGQHLYTRQDIMILLGKLARANWGMTAEPLIADLLPWMNAKRTSDQIIFDFEKRFQCKFEDVKRINADIESDDEDDWSNIIKRYSNLPYSR